MAIARNTLKGMPDGWGEEAFAELVRIYKDATLRLGAIAQKHLVRDQRQLTVAANRARAAMIEVERVLAELDQEAAQWIAQNIPQAYRVGAKKTLAGLAEIGVKGAVSFDPAFHEEAIRVLVSDMQDTLLEASESISRQFRRTLRRTQLARVTDKKISEQVAKSLISGDTQRTLSKNILKALQSDLDDGMVVINGRRYDPAKYAKMVARTKTREAVTAGQVNELIEAGQDLTMVTRHGAPDGCRFYEGRVFSISGTSEKYPGLGELPNGGPPFHPNCRHNLAPYVEDLASRAEKKRAVDIDRRALGKPYKDVEKMARKAA